ncbi:MAG: hypothetical protein RL685_7649 [Pseudomonadota bacterium]
MLQRVRSGRAPDSLLVALQGLELIGLEALTAVSQELGAQRLPTVVIVDAEARTRFESLPEAQLADRILVHPVDDSGLFDAMLDPQALIGVVRRHVDRVRLARAAEPPLIEPKPGDARVLSSPDCDPTAWRRTAAHPHDAAHLRPCCLRARAQRRPPKQ